MTTGLKRKKILAAEGGSSVLPFGGLVSATNLVSYWRLNEESGIRADSYGTQHLTPTNNPLGTVGKIGGGCKFVSASQQNLRHSDTIPLGDENFTYTFWFRKTQATGGQAMFIAKHDDTNDDYFIYLTGPFQIGFSITGIGAAFSSTITDNIDWHFIVCWFDTVLNTVNIQMDNGTVVSGAASAAHVAKGGPVLFAARVFTGSPSPFNGTMDEVGLWRRVLTIEERTALWNSGSGLGYFGETMNYSNAVVTDGATNYWRLEEASGLVFADSKGTQPATVTSAVGITYRVSSGLPDGSFGVAVNGTQPPASITGIGSTPPWTIEVLLTPKNIRSRIPPATIRNLHIIGHGGGNFSFSLKQPSSGIGPIQYLMFRPGFEQYGSTTLIVGNRYHLVVTMDAAEHGILYCNGVADGMFDWPGVSWPSISFATLIGNFNGVSPGTLEAQCIDEIALYAGLVLTPTQVAAHAALARV